MTKTASMSGNPTSLRLEKKAGRITMKSAMGHLQPGSRRNRLLRVVPGGDTRRITCGVVVFRKHPIKDDLYF